MKERRYYKNLAKSAFRRNYWICVLVCLILLIFCEEGNNDFLSIGSSLGTDDGVISEVQDLVNDGNSSNYVSDQDMDADSDDVISLDEYFNDDSSEDSSVSVVSDDSSSDSFAMNFKSEFLDNIMPLSFLSDFFEKQGTIIVALVGILSVIFSIFILPIIQIGGCRFFLDNRNEPASAGLLVSDFDGRYFLTHVLISFLQTVYIVLWTLLLVIPGIVKSYQYSMIPYLLADHPELSRKDAFRMSKELTSGNKWNLFVLDLSFILWDILNSITLGILGVFWLNPYKHATKAEVYRDLYDSLYGNHTEYDGSVYGNYTEYDDSVYGNHTEYDETTFM